MKPIPEVENAKAEVSSKTHLSVVKYVCEKPYVLVETSQVQCLFSEWEGQPPKCEISKYLFLFTLLFFTKLRT